MDLWLVGRTLMEAASYLALRVFRLDSDYATSNCASFFSYRSSAALISGR
jgi:hypothetical protein